MPHPLPAPIAEVLTEGYTDYSETTLRVYRTSWRDLLGWLETERGRPEARRGPAGDKRDRGAEKPGRSAGNRRPLLPEPEPIAEYLREHDHLAWSTLTSRRQAFRLVYRELVGEDPFDHPAVEEAWRAVRHKKQAEPDTAPKRRLDEREHGLAAIIEEGPALLSSHLGRTLSEERQRDLRYLPDETTRTEDLPPEVRDLIPAPTYDLQVLRNRALLLLVATARLTRPAIVGVDLEDVVPPEEGGPTRIVVYDRGGDPAFVLRLETAPAVADCPHRAVAAWILAADLTEGPLFRSFTPHGEVSEDRIRPQTINYVIKRCAEDAGLDPEGWSTRRLQP